MENRFQKIRELGSKGKRSNPLLLEEFQWENEWVCENDPVHEGDGPGAGISWNDVDDATGATEGLQGRNFPRAASKKTYVRKRKRASKQAATEDDDSDSDQPDEGIQSDPMEEDDSATGIQQAAADEGFQLNNDLLE